MVQEADWSFFATAHGKGPVDGVGGTVKRAVSRRVLQQMALVNTAQEFADIATEACPNINIILVDQTEVEHVKTQLSAFLVRRCSQSHSRHIQQSLF